jgi:hypothetical protein
VGKTEVSLKLNSSIQLIPIHFADQANLVLKLSIQMPKHEGNVFDVKQKDNIRKNIFLIQECL